ncbi:hypothetical protein N7G274_010739 [Stereocaulon virgatum]|uniref:CENP-V/GFA domain-containing protein n=1 Tax=Stereocaulon virgatum TaxID=373712 RepID=A0ABR3ZSZ4_9LECA
MSNATTEGDSKLWYEANCHCGAVKYKVKLPNLETHLVTSCNCSICTKNGYLNVYPSSKEVIWHSGYDTLNDYRFGRKRFDHKFCPSCGSSILIDFHHPDELAVNVRMIKDIKIDKLNIRYFDGKHELEPKYEIGQDVKEAQS